ncbi:MAG: DUF418 domain-containing protein, partial [Vicinamibacterales bacterium]
RMSIAFGHIAVVMLLCKLTASRASRLMDPLAAAGRMALTNYVMQTVIGLVLFSGLGFGWYGALARHQLYYVVAAIWLVQLTVSPLWLRAFDFGPLEWLWRSLIYWRRPPFRNPGLTHLTGQRPT